MSTFVPRLYYFNLAGRAEGIRLLCAYAGLPLDDVRMMARDEVVPMREVRQRENALVLVIFEDSELFYR
jgi:hypothetical protein